MTAAARGMRRLLGGAPEALAVPDDILTHALFLDASLGVVILDRAMRIVRANPAMQQIVGNPGSLAPGSLAEELFGEAARPELQRELRAALSGKRGARRLSGRLADTSSVTQRPMHTGDEVDDATRVEISIAPIRGRAVPDRARPAPPGPGLPGPGLPGRGLPGRGLPGRSQPGPEQAGHEAAEVVGVVLWLTDVSAQQQLEAQLAQVHRLQALGQFAGGIAHDFNNLLTAILGAADLVLTRDDLDGAVHAEVRQIYQSAERGASLVRQLLAFGRQQRLQPRVIAVNDAIRDLSGLLTRLLGGKIALSLDLEQPHRLIRVDPTQLDQVLVNLCVNARDAMPDGGRLILRSGRTTLYRSLTRGQETIPPGRYVMVEVEDNGGGIPADVLPRIFDPFFTTKREQGGTGLGLSTVHGIVRQSGGFLTVDSELGRGTRVRLYLPRADAASEQAPLPLFETPGPIPYLPLADRPSPVIPGPAASAGPPASATADAPEGARTVLLVDDEDGVRLVTERALRRRGWAVLAASSAEEALRVASVRMAMALPLHAIISDVMMPGIDGPTLVRALRETHGRLPAILISGYAEESLRAQLSADDVAFLAKPFSFAALFAMLEDVASVPASGPLRLSA